MKANLATLLCGAALVALSGPALRAASPPTLAAAAQSQSSRATDKQFEQMQARMKLMQEQMSRIRQATDPKERQRLLHEHMQTMLEQMKAMRVMGGA